MARKATVTKPSAIAINKKAQADDDGEDVGTALVAMPKSTALSLDVGMLALNHLTAFATDTQMIDELREGKESHRGKAQVLLAIAARKAALADKSINLVHAVSGSKVEKNIVANQIRLAIGLMTSDGSKLVWTPEARARMFRMPEDDVKTLKRKSSVRTNFSTMLTKSMRVALHTIENNLDVKEEGGTLRITDTKKSGGAVAKHFGSASVLLNEDQNTPVFDKKGKPTGVTKTLKALPSFTEIMREVGKSHGVEIVARKDSRVTSVDPAKHVIEVATNLLKAVNNLPAEVPEEVKKALDALRNAIEEKID